MGALFQHERLRSSPVSPDWCERGEESRHAAIGKGADRRGLPFDIPRFTAGERLRFVPTRPGRFPLLEPGSSAPRPVRVIDQNGQLYALMPRGWIGTAAVPVREVAGEWAAA